MIKQRDRDRAALMLYELEANRLMVTLLPSMDEAIAAGDAVGVAEGDTGCR